MIKHKGGVISNHTGTPPPWTSPSSSHDTALSWPRRLSPSSLYSAASSLAPPLPSWAYLCSSYIGFLCVPQTMTSITLPSTPWASAQPRRPSASPNPTYLPGNSFDFARENFLDSSSPRASRCFTIPPLSGLLHRCFTQDYSVFIDSFID